MAGENLDLSSEPEFDPDEAGQGGRPFVGIHFACCDVYSRIYLHRDREKQIGNCPRCGRKIVLRVGPGGSDARFFRAQ